MKPRVQPSRGTGWLTIGAGLSFAAAALHIVVIAGGPDWYRFFGAGEELASAAERGELTPHILTILIASVLFVWGLYALSGAGRLRRLPFLRFCLVAIAGVYLARGLVLIPALALNWENIEPFTVWSSLIVLGYGVAYAIGTWLAWPELRPQ